MTDYKRWKVLQIIPAQVGWKAVHSQESANRQIAIFYRAIICWALVEAVEGNGAGRTEVRGIAQQSKYLAVVEDLITETEDGIDRNQYFLGYDDPDAHKESDYWIKQANGRLRAEKDKRS